MPRGPWPRRRLAVIRALSPRAASPIDLTPGSLFIPARLVRNLTPLPPAYSACRIARWSDPPIRPGLAAAAVASPRPGRDWRQHPYRPGQPLLEQGRVPGAASLRMFLIVWACSVRTVLRSAGSSMAPRRGAWPAPARTRPWLDSARAAASCSGVIAFSVRRRIGAYCPALRRARLRRRPWLETPSVPLRWLRQPRRECVENVAGWLRGLPRCGPLRSG